MACTGYDSGENTSGNSSPATTIDTIQLTIELFFYQQKQFPVLSDKECLFYYKLIKCAQSWLEVGDNNDEGEKEEELDDDDNKEED